LNTVRATLKDGRTVDYVYKDDPPQGGMKVVYFTPDKSLALCFFKNQNTGADPNRIARLESIIGRFNPTVLRTDGGAAPNQMSADYFKRLFCWPTAIITQPRLGIMTPVYQPNFFFSSGRFAGKDKEGKWFTSPKLRKLIPPEEVGDWLGYLNLCTRMARAVAKMHMTGLAHSDLSNKNVLVDPRSGTCSIIDIDSLVVPQKFAPDVLGTPGYIAPEVMVGITYPMGHPNRILPSNWTDLHALGVLIYENLLRRHPLRGPKVNCTTSSEEDERLSMGEKSLFIEHPQDDSNRPHQNCRNAAYRYDLKVKVEHLGSHLSKCFMQTFVNGLHEPNKRTVATAWVDALCRTQDFLIRCGNGSCPEKWFVYLDGQKPTCPWCGWQLKTQIPVLDFHYAPRQGQFRPENHCLVAWDQRILHEWHVFSNKRMDENANPVGLADVHFYQGQWILINRGLDSMVSPSGNPVPKEQAVALKDGDEILLSKAEKGRLVTVRMIP